MYFGKKYYSRNLTCSKLFLLSWYFKKPGKKLTLVDKWLPILYSPICVFYDMLSSTWLTAKYYNHRINFGRNVTENKYISKF